MPQHGLQNGMLPKQKPPAFLIFADLDGTFTPMDIDGKIDFINVVKEIQEREKVFVKFIPVSGRPAGYVLRLLHECRDMLKSVGIHDACEFGAAEQGAMIVDSSKSYGPIFTGYPENTKLKSKIANILSKNEYTDIISDEPDKLYTCSIHIKNEDKAHMNEEEQLKVYLSCRKDIEDVFGKGVLDISMSHNCMEVMTREIKKSHAIDLLMERYARDYKIVGILYAGDAENDKVAMKHVSKLAEIPGINAHNFTPSNAQDAIQTHQIEQWKYENRMAHKHYVEKGTKPLFFGITELIRRAMDQRRLCGKGIICSETRDDHDMEYLREVKLAERELRRLRAISLTDAFVHLPDDQN